MGTSDGYHDTDALEGLPGLAVTSRTTCPRCPFVLHSWGILQSGQHGAARSFRDPCLFEVHFIIFN